MTDGNTAIISLCFICTGNNLCGGFIKKMGEKCCQTYRIKKMEKET